MWAEEQELLAQRMRREERLFGFTGAVVLCVLIEALMVLATFAIIRVASS